MTQQFVALKANAANVPIDNGGGSYTLTVTVADDSGVYNGLNVAAGMKLLKIGDGGVAGQMKSYDIASVSNVFALELDITVTDINADGNPNFGDFAIVQPSTQGIFPVVSGVNPGLQQAITQYNLDALDAIGGIPEKLVAVSVTGGSLPVAGLPLSPSMVAVYVSGIRFIDVLPSSTSVIGFHIATAGQVEFNVPLDDESVLVEWL